MTAVIKKRSVLKAIVFFSIAILSPACATLGIFDHYPLITAAENGDLAKARELIENHADVNQVSEDQRFALSAAASNGNLEMVKLMVNHGADVNLTNDYGTTALMEAASKGHEPVAAFLIDHGADVSMTNKGEFSALYCAVDSGDMDIVKLLVEHHAPVNFDKNPVCPLFLAVKKGNREVAAYLIENGADLNILDSDNYTPLQMAAQKASYELAKLLIDKGADVRIKNGKGTDALFIADGQDYVAIMNNLYERVKDSVQGADVDSVDGETPKKNNLYTILCLLEFIDPKYSTPAAMKEFYNSLDKSPLAIDIPETQFKNMADQLKKDYLSTIKMLLDHGADVNTKDKNNQTILMKICSQENRLSDLFTKKSIQLSPEVDKRYHIALDTAQSIHEELIQLLISSGADVNLKDIYNKTALMSACQNGNYEYATILLKNGATVNRSNNDGWTPLLYAASNGDVRISELLLSNGADVNAKNAFGETVLLRAVYENNPALVSLLIQKGANPDIANLQGASPRSVARKNGNSDIIRMMK